MTFGGYKFAGYCLPYDSNVTGVARALAIHKTRLKAFTEAARLSESAWVFDPDKLTGTIAFESTQNAIHILTDESSADRGYASFFKYTGQKTGYYLILTVQKYSLGTYSGGVRFVRGQCLAATGTTSSFGPINASCFHALSENPFGNLPQEGLESPTFVPSSSTRIMSIGVNLITNDSSKLQNIEKGYVNPDSSGQTYCIFGYAMRGADFHQFNRTGKSFYDDHSIVQSLSLDAFSSYYCQNDTHGLLALSLAGYNNSTSAYEYYTSESKYGNDGQVLSESGSEICLNNSSSNSYNNNSLIIAPDLRSCYCPNAGGNLVTSGAIIALSYGSGYRMFDSGQLAKGCTNPEFIAINCTSPANSQNTFSPYTYNLLLVSKYNSVVSSIQNASVSNSSPSGSTNIYIGWDASNPDIRTEAAWPIYTP